MDWTTRFSYSPVEAVTNEKIYDTDETRVIVRYRDGRTIIHERLPILDALKYDISYDGRLLLCYDSHAELYCFDTVTGELRWTEYGMPDGILTEDGILRIGLMDTPQGRWRLLHKLSLDTAEPILCRELPHCLQGEFRDLDREHVLVQLDETTAAVLRKSDLETVRVVPLTENDL